MEKKWDITHLVILNNLPSGWSRSRLCQLLETRKVALHYEFYLQYIAINRALFSYVLTFFSRHEDSLAVEG